ncbi:MAG: MBL fold metallo-hydrolase [Deltaproteobacteria bacterium]|nr:MBL fold metallo-hydrolase [Deltaproteobacteria bacterium]
MEILTIPVTPVQQNCRILTNDKEAIVIDPGGDVDKILNMISQRNLTLVEIWLTHSHFDHCGGVGKLIEKFPNINLVAHPIEKEFRKFAHQIATQWGIFDVVECPEPTKEIEDDAQMEVFGREVKVLFTPGHSPGHLVFYFPEDGFAISGDTVFQGSIGRTDLPGADYKVFMQSIRTKILTLPDEVRLLPGHGPDTTVGREKITNPFLI